MSVRLPRVVADVPLDTTIEGLFRDQVETRRRMAELSVENLFRGLRGEPLLHRVV
jgi:hypothetical protein